MSPLPDPDLFRLPESMVAPARPPARPPRHGAKQKFLKGPIPWSWLDRAGHLPGKALAVGLVLWWKAGLAGRRTVRLCLAGIDELGLNEDSARRGIRALEEAGLIEVRRRPGRGLEVTLLEASDSRVGMYYSARDRGEAGEIEHSEDREG